MKLIVTLCLGIMFLGILSVIPASADIPTNVVDQYWVWYPTLNPPKNADPGYWVNYINKLGVCAPVWENNKTKLDILNIEQPNYTKNIWVEAKFVTPQTKIADLHITDPSGVTYNPVNSWISINGQIVTWQWTLPIQPSYETVKFNNKDFYNLKGIELLEIGTQCSPVPEPSCILAFGSGLIGLTGLVIRRRK